MEYELGIRLDILSQQLDAMQKKMDLLLKAAEVVEPTETKKGKKNG